MKSDSMKSDIEKRFILLGLCVVFYIPQAHAEESFGRLFSTASERRTLDQLRQTQPLKAEKEATQKTDPEETIATENSNSSRVSLQGYVKRSDGQNTLWVNEHPIKENSQIDNVSVGRVNEHQASPSVELKIKTKNQTIKLKPGQVYQTESEQVQDVQLVQKIKEIELKESSVGKDTPSRN